MSWAIKNDEFVSLFHLHRAPNFRDSEQFQSRQHMFFRLTLSFRDSERFWSTHQTLSPPCTEFSWQRTITWFSNGTWFWTHQVKNESSLNGVWNTYLHDTVDIPRCCYWKCDTSASLMNGRNHPDNYATASVRDTFERNMALADNMFEIHKLTMTIDPIKYDTIELLLVLLCVQRIPEIKSRRLLWPYILHIHNFFV